MTFHKNRSITTNLSRHHQAGVTLLLSVLVLSAISAITFSLATIAFVEVRSSTDALRTDISYYNDQGIYEDALFAFKRKIASIKDTFGTISAGNNCSNFVNFNGPLYPTVTSKTRRCYFDAENVILKLIPVSASYADAIKFGIYDPAFLTPGAQTSGFAKLKINNISDNTIIIYICQLDIGCSESGGGFTLSTPTTLSASGSTEFNLDTNQSYELAIKNNNATKALVQIETYGPSNAPKGLPEEGKEFIDIESSRGDITRRVNLTVPTQ